MQNSRRVVITGMGLVSSIGNSISKVTDSLINSKSGIEFDQSFKDAGLKSCVAGTLPDPKKMMKDMGKKKLTRFMSDGAAFAYLSAIQAIKDANISYELLNDFRTGVIMGNGAGSPQICVKGAEILKNRGLKRISPFLVSQCMASSSVANLATLLKIRGPSYAISSACASSAHAIGSACKEIVWGGVDIMLAGGCEDLNALNASVFDAARALSRNNDNVETASRAYDENRDGFVISGGGGIIILEERQHAIDRDAKIYAEVIGYGATSDGEDMVKPSGKGATRCMHDAIACCPDIVPSDVDYINTHGTSTPAGDIVELDAIKYVFEKYKMPYISSTKSLTGHSIGAAAVHEIIYSIIMMENDFIAPSVNIENVDPKAAKFPIITERVDKSPSIVMSNSFGFGGTNAVLIIKKFS